jgi:uncharacterized membrane protein
MGAMFACYLLLFRIETCRRQTLVTITITPIILFSYSSEFNRFYRVFHELFWPALSSTLDCFLDAIPPFRIS